MDWKFHLATWPSAAIGVVAVWLAWKALHPSSYIEFHPKWNVELKAGVFTVTGKITWVSPAASFTTTGSLKFNHNTVNLRLKSADGHLLERDTNVLVLEGQYTNGIIAEGCLAVLRLKVRLSNGKTKRFKAKTVINQLASQSPQ